MQQLRALHMAGVHCPRCGKGMTAAPLRVVREYISRISARVKVPAVYRTIVLNQINEQVAKDARIPYCSTCHHVIEGGLP